MASIGNRRIWATVVSVAVAITILTVAGWTLFGNHGGDSSVGGDVQIIPLVDASTGAEPTPKANTPSRETPEVSPTPEDIAVYLTGEVVNPGVYEIPDGHRLTDVVDLAGGPTDDADLDRINLAAYVSDAVHYRIPATGEPESAAVETVSAAVSTGQREADQPTPVSLCATPLDINAASAECLETLPGIGSVRAESIVSHREQAGPFATADGITAVSGIGDGIYGRIAGLITVGSQ